MIKITIFSLNMTIFSFIFIKILEINFFPLICFLDEMLRNCKDYLHENDGISLLFFVFRNALRERCEQIHGYRCIFTYFIMRLLDPINRIRFNKNFFRH